MPPDTLVSTGLVLKLAHQQVECQRVLLGWEQLIVSHQEVAGTDVVEVEIIVLIACDIALRVDHRGRVLLEIFAQPLVAIGGIDVKHPVELYSRLVRPVRHPDREIEMVRMWCPLHFRSCNPLAEMVIVSRSDAYGDEQH